MGTTTKTTLVGNHPMSTSTVTQLIWQTQTMKLKNESIWEPGRLTDEMFTQISHLDVIGGIYSSVSLQMRKPNTFVLLWPCGLYSGTL